jgi:hypothetical protein
MGMLSTERPSSQTNAFTEPADQVWPAHYILKKSGRFHQDGTTSCRAPLRLAPDSLCATRPCASRRTRLVPRTPPVPRAPRHPRQRAFIWRQQVDEHMLQPYVSWVLDVCCICFIWMLQKYIWCYICCNDYTRMLQVYVSNVSAVSNVCCKCFIWMLHMLQWLYTYVASVFPNVSAVLSGHCICCSGYTCMLQVYVSNVSPILGVWCKCFI